MIIKKVGIKKFSFLFLTFLLSINFATLAIALAGNDSPEEPKGEVKILEVPGLSENVVQYNKTDIVPVAQEEKVPSGEPSLFAYQNTTMLFNFTMTCDLVITAEATANQKIFALFVDPNQSMTLTMNFGSEPFQSEQDSEKNLNFYASIEPNSTVELQAQLKLYINQTELMQELGRDVDSENLTWMFWNGTQNEWIKVPSFIDQHGYLTCNTDHFSIWTVGEIAETENQTEGGVDMTLVYGGVGAVIVSVVALGAILYSKRN